MSLLRLRTVACAGLLAGCLAIAAPAQAQQQNAARPEVGKPLQAAAADLKARRGRDALAEVAKAEAVPNRTPYENFLIAQIKASAATLVGDYDTAISASEAVLNSGRVSGAQASDMEKAIAVAYYQKKDYAKAAQWTQRYLKNGANDPAMREILLQSYYLSGDCTAVNRAVGNEESRVGEKDLQMLLNCYERSHDTGGYVATMEKLVVYYPKKEYWSDLLARVQKKPGFSDRLALHVYRLKLATGNMNGTNDYMEMAQLALQAGVPAEARKVVDRGYEVKALGTGPEASRHQRLRDLVARNMAEAEKTRAAAEQGDGNDLVKVGMNYVFDGKADKGISLIEQGIKKGGLKRPEDAKLTLGEAQIMGGQKSRGVQTLRGVQGSDGTADIARLWVLNARA
jgi:outer membrane protein assembly factor BamD (BamD/ComL family)